MFKMIHKLNLLLVFTPLLFLSCSTGKLNTIATVDRNLKELSAVETIPKSPLFWSIEDSGNANTLYGLNTDGAIVKNIRVVNVTNRDWEDLTSDREGNLYIGDFGNNKKKYKKYFIYKVSNLNRINNETVAQTITFKLPKELKQKDFEAFFLWKQYFYLFSKESKKVTLIKVPNRVGEHTAKLITTFSFKGKHTQITSSDISEDGKKIVLLNHDKVILLSHFKTDNFFNDTIDYLTFNHDSQKEGICFKNNNTLIITDESNPIKGGHIYELSLN